MTVLKEIGIAISSARKENGLTQEQFAELVGISERTLREIENGKGNPSFTAVARSADALGMVLGVLS